MIEVTREAPDKLSDQSWGFSVFSNGSGTELTVKVSKYAVRSRPTTRHKMKVDGLWDSFDQRSYHSTIRAADVPVPDDVVQDALRSVSAVLALPTGEKLPLPLTAPNERK